MKYQLYAYRRPWFTFGGRSKSKSHGSLALECQTGAPARDRYPLAPGMHQQVQLRLLLTHSPFKCSALLAQVIGGAAPAALAAPANGLALMGLIYAFGSTSGAHLSKSSTMLLGHVCVQHETAAG